MSRPTEPLYSPSNEPSGLFAKASRFAKKLTWLSPVETLGSVGGREFGRQIESSIHDVVTSQKARLIRLRKQDAAVVITVPQYEEMVRLKNLYLELIEKVKEKEIAETGDEFDQLFARIRSVESRKAADLLFSAPSSDVAAAYKPGRTEKN